MKIGILAFQGSFEEHATMVKRAISELSYSGDVISLKKPSQLDTIDAVILPGGESTTIGTLANLTGLLPELREKIASGLPVLGTCAGAILLAKEAVDSRVKDKKQPLIGTMNIGVVRNYFGRQRESFESSLNLYGERINTVFIRAPAIVKTWGKAEVLAHFNNVIAAAEEDNMIATIFHPELSDSTVVHRALLKKAKR